MTVFVLMKEISGTDGKAVVEGVYYYRPEPLPDQWVEEFEIDAEACGPEKLKVKVNVDVGLTIRELVKEACETAKAKGWHETERPPLEYHALIHSEISEATEQAREETPFVWFSSESFPSLPSSRWTPSHDKPEGELIELADAVIRIADYCGSRGWDLEEAIKLKMDYNKTRPHRHGGKKY